MIIFGFGTNGGKNFTNSFLVICYQNYGSSVQGNNAFLFGYKYSFISCENCRGQSANKMKNFHVEMKHVIVGIRNQENYFRRNGSRYSRSNELCIRRINTPPLKVKKMFVIVRTVFRKPKIVQLIYQLGLFQCVHLQIKKLHQWKHKIAQTKYQTYYLMRFTWSFI